MGDQNQFPSGTVTFLFTDIEGITRLAQEHPKEMPELLARHNAILNQAIEMYHGFVFRIVGDSFSAAFPTASDCHFRQTERAQAVNKPVQSHTVIVDLGELISRERGRLRLVTCLKNTFSSHLSWRMAPGGAAL
jgi:class 3 adenylate cyclase